LRHFRLAACRTHFSGVTAEIGREMSLVQNYRTTFSDEIANHGIDGLISRLAAKTRG
jgi:hypothetical protein